MIIIKYIFDWFISLGFSTNDLCIVLILTGVLMEIIAVYIMREVDR